METTSLNGIWKIKWSDGQRGGMPNYIHVPGQRKETHIHGLKKRVDDSYDEMKWIDAIVPGEVHLDLMKAGMIESPYRGLGVLHCRWVEECIWFYRREFDLPAQAGSRFAQLVFEGLDYAAAIYLNGEEIGRHENAFYPCSIDVSGLLKPVGNVLLVQLESGLFTVSEKPVKEYYSATMTMDILLHKRNWLRKTQSQMAWDWSPRLMNVGIFLPVTLKTSEEMIVDSIALTSSLNDTLDCGELHVRVFAGQHCADLKNISLAITADGSTHEYEFDRMPADGTLMADVPVDAPDLWWPAGYGKQNMYNVGISVRINGREVFYQQKKTGFRHVRVNQDPHPDKGTYFVFTINHQPVFMRGANMVPNDMITAAISPARYGRLLDLALEANFNFLRVWGGGLYESDDFYDCCNEKGIMVWQEFIAACAVIPVADQNLLDSVRNEALYNIRRLSAHPSLVAWCGNNEIGWGCVGQDDFHCGEDNILYDELFPSLLRLEDPDKYYQPTSPYSKTSNDYNEETTGDQHPWAIGFENKDSRGYEKFTCRFPDEGGILGPVSLKTMKECLRDGESVHSFSWQVHDNMEENWVPGSSPDEDVKFWMDLDPRKMTLEEYVYCGGFVQGEGLKRYVDNFRRRKYNSSGAVFWMYSDCWPATRSWTIVDYNLNKTPSFHPVRRSFEPVSPVIALEDGKYTVYGVNDLLADWEGSIRFGIFYADGRYFADIKKEVTLAGNASTVIECVEYPETDGEQVFIFASLYNKDNELVARTRYNNLKYSELQLQPSLISVEKTPDGYVLSSDVFVMGVCLGLDGDEQIGDNMFDLYPGQPYVVQAAGLNDSPVLYDLNTFLKFKYGG